MSGIRLANRRRCPRFLMALCVLGLYWPIGCVQPEALDPEPGQLEYQTPLWMAIPGAHVNLAGGNLIVRRVDLSIDTLFGELSVGATFNSSRGVWLWSFDTSYDGVVFVDESGAEHPVAGLAPGSAVPGTHWVKLDSQRMKTRGGLVHSFDSLTHRLSMLSWEGHAFPHLAYEVEATPLGERVVAITQCRETLGCRETFGITYDTNGCVERIDDRAGRTALFEHDAACRTLSARDGLDVARDWAGRRYQYAFGQLWSVTNSEGERTEYAIVDGRVMATRIGAATESRTRFRYGWDDSSGLYFTGVTDPAGGDSLYRYDAEGRLHEYRDATRYLTRITWSGRRPATHTDPAGAVTAWEWQEDDLARVTQPSGNVIVVEYAPGAHDRTNPLIRPILRITDDVGVVEERHYFANGQVSQILSGTGDGQGFAYDAEGNVASVTAPGGASVELRLFGDHGHASEVWSQGYRVSRVYDEVGNLLEGGGIGDPLSSRRPGIGRRGYDEDRNWVSVELTGGTASDPFTEEVAEIRVAYRSDGWPVSITRPYGGDSLFAYDDRGLLANRRDRVDGAWQETRTEYDARGLVIALERPNRMRVETDYDPAGRVVVTRLMRAGAVEKVLGTTWLDGRLEHRSDSSYPAAERFEYDAAGRPRRIVFPGGETLETDYDSRSRVVERRYLDSAGVLLRTIGVAWDAADRPVRIVDDGETVLEKEWWMGREAWIRYGSGLLRTMTYDDVSGLLQETSTTDSAGAGIERTTTSWAECGSDMICLAVRTETFQQPIGLEEMVTDEAYAMGPFSEDELAAGGFGMRLRNWHPFFDPQGAGTAQNRQAFDALGNRIGVAAPVTPPYTVFHYNAERNRLLSADLPEHHEYEWDEAGYLVRRDGVEISWDAGGRLTAIGSDHVYEWDVLGRPVRSVVEGLERRSLFGGEVQADATRTPLALDLGEVRIDLVLGLHLYRHYDFRGNVKWVSGETGEVLRHYAYGPWGVEAEHGDHPDDVSFARGRGLGGFLLVGARVYDPETGRFISPDPAGHAVNLHAYTQGNPVLFWDPGGTHAVPIGRAVTGQGQQSGRVTVGRTLAQLGIATVGAGIVVGNGHIMFGGGVLTLTGLVLMLQGSQGHGLCSCGHVSIIDLTPGQISSLGSASGAPSQEQDAPAVCAPRVATHPSARRWWIGLLVPAQVLLGAAFLGRARRSPPCADPAPACSAGDRLTKPARARGAPG